MNIFVPGRKDRKALTSCPAMSLHLTLAPPSTISSIMICTSLLSTPLTWIICGVSPMPPLIDVGVTVPDLERIGGVLRPVVLCIGEPECYLVESTNKS